MKNFWNKLKMNMAKNEFCVFIISYRRPDRVYTYKALRRQGYTGPIYIIVGTDDDTLDEYRQRFGNEVIVFEKKDYLDIDTFDNLDDLQMTAYVRNAVYDIAEQLGYEYFFVADDDYLHFRWHINSKFTPVEYDIKNMDRMLYSLYSFYRDTPFHCVAISQSGDFLGGSKSVIDKLQKEGGTRKAMNFYICSTKRRVKWISRFNEDVNTYVFWGHRGYLFITTFAVMQRQVRTQFNPGGLTEAYRRYGTYVKAFSSVMAHPSGVCVSEMGLVDRRPHHRVNWEKTVPYIVREKR